ncbi:MAG: S24/S26 family peptidase [Lachnospiraceae bacterium]|nr:S24/S26 family peptidase [Lachnospiraceae bacterium]
MTECNKRTINANTYISTLRQIVENGQEVSLKISGSSMMPFLIHERDMILFGPVKGELKKGDMVFFQRQEGQFVMHRICKITPEGYYIVGDAQVVIEGPIKREQIFAKVNRARRKGKWIDENDFWWKFFEKVWIRIIPLRHVIMRTYMILTGKNKKKD